MILTSQNATIWNWVVQGRWHFRDMMVKNPCLRLYIKLNTVAFQRNYFNCFWIYYPLFNIIIFDCEIAINQVSAISKLCIPDGTIFAVVTKGIGTNIYYEKNGKQVEAFDTPDEDNVIELNGIKSELMISESTLGEV